MVHIVNVRKNALLKVRSNIGRGSRIVDLLQSEYKPNNTIYNNISFGNANIFQTENTINQCDIKDGNSPSLESSKNRSQNRKLAALNKLMFEALQML